MRVKMFGPSLSATSGISAVVNNWLAVGLASRIDLEYVATLDEYVPGQLVRKTGNAVRSYFKCLRMNRMTADLVHLHVSSHMSFYRKLPIFLWSKLMRLPIVTHLHGSSFENFYRAGSAIRRYLIRLMFVRSSVVLALSESWAAFISSIAPRARLVVLYNGAPADLYTGTRGPKSEITVLFMGRLGARKGTRDLIDAFELIAAERPNARLVLGGDGDVEAFRALAAAKGLSGRVAIPGWIGADRKAEVFVNCDIYVLPSYNEGLPGSILEAMAAGKPVISTPVGGIAEAVIDGVNGFLIEPGDVRALAERLARLIDEPRLREKMGGQSRRLLNEGFESGKLVDRLVQIYDATMHPESDKLALLECRSN